MVYFPTTATGKFVCWGEKLLSWTFCWVSGIRRTTLCAEKNVKFGNLHFFVENNLFNINVWHLFFLFYKILSEGGLKFTHHIHFNWPE